MAKEPQLKIDLNKIILFWREIGQKYEKIKEDPEKSEKDISLGTTSLGMSIGGTIMAIAFAYFAFYLLALMRDTSPSAGGLFLMIGGAFCAIICAIIAVVSLVYLTFASIVYAHYQRKLNKQKIGIIALIVSLLLSVGIIVSVIVIALKFFVLQ